MARSQVLLAMFVLFGAACGNDMHRGRPIGPTSPSYVISVDHQSAGGQPYPRGMNSKQISISVGQGSNAVPYQFTVDTGSATLIMTCRTPVSLKNCNNNLPPSSNYELTAEKTVSTAAVCDATGIGCLMPNKQCLMSEVLTGKVGYDNINNAIVGQDTVTINNLISGPAPTLSIPQALFGCAQAYVQCTPSSPANCFSSTTTCPATAAAIEPLFAGSCPGSGHGIEAGWTFNAGGTPSAIGIPEMAYNAGLIKQKVTGSCYQQPQKNTDCRIPLSPNSAVVLGPALPRMIASRSQLYSAPLAPLSMSTFPSNLPANSASPKVHTFRSAVQSARVPGYNNAAPTSISFTSSSVSILWDTGAYGQSTVPESVFQAYISYYNSARAAAVNSALARRYNFNIQPCANANEVCGSNLSGENACQYISLPTATSTRVVNAAAGLLLSMYPASIDITVQGGAVVRLPTAFRVNLCSGNSNLQTSGVAVCSYVQSSGTSSSYFWLAGPWFFGRFVQFDGSAPAPGYANSTGTVYWSDPISSCAF